MAVTIREAANIVCYWFLGFRRRPNSLHGSWWVNCSQRVTQFHVRTELHATTKAKQYGNSLEIVLCMDNTTQKRFHAAKWRKAVKGAAKMDGRIWLGMGVFLRILELEHKPWQPPGWGLD